MELAESIKDGFYFCCQNCGRCCTHHWEGTVLLFHNDIDALTKELDMDAEEFAEEYTATYLYDFYVWDEDLNHVKNKKSEELEVLGFDMEENKDCAFLGRKNGKTYCKVYNAWPFQCKSYPFWTITMGDEKQLQETMKICEGFLTREEILEKGLDPLDYFYPPDKIKELVFKERKLMRSYFYKLKKSNNDLSMCYGFKVRE